jgi:putative FmdB family regulatory protein
MPIYEYRCRQCHHTFENIVLSIREKISCPKCQSSAVEKQLSVFSSPGAQSEKTVSAGGCGCTPATCGCH